jgi:hypothetical protein
MIIYNLTQKLLCMISSINDYLLKRDRRACLSSSLDIGDKDLPLLVGTRGADGGESSTPGPASLPRTVPHISQASTEVPLL